MRLRWNPPRQRHVGCRHDCVCQEFVFRGIGRAVCGVVSVDAGGGLLLVIGDFLLRWERSLYGVSGSEPECMSECMPFDKWCLGE